MLKKLRYFDFLLLLKKQCFSWTRFNYLHLSCSDSGGLNFVKIYSIYHKTTAKKREKNIKYGWGSSLWESVLAQPNCVYLQHQNANVEQSKDQWNQSKNILEDYHNDILLTNRANNYWSINEAYIILAKPGIDWIKMQLTNKWFTRMFSHKRVFRCRIDILIKLKWWFCP